MRQTLLILGLLTLAGSWLGPLPELARAAFWAHMVLHMLVVAVAAPLISLSLAGTVYDPVPRAPLVFAPIPASVIELILVWTWHAPLLHHFARSSFWGFVAEQSTFLIAGLWLWLSAFGGTSESRGRRNAAGVIGLLLTSMHMTFLGALLALSPREVYLHHHGASAASSMTMTPLEDQHLGGAVMILIGGIAYLGGGLWLMVGILRNRTDKQKEQS